MNDDLKERLTDLAFELKKHHRRYRSSFRNVIIFYIFIIIFVLIYTTIIGYKIQELAEPRTAAALIGSKVIVTPEYGRDLDPAAELLAGGLSEAKRSFAGSFFAYFFLEKSR